MAESLSKLIEIRKVKVEMWVVGGGELHMQYGLTFQLEQMWSAIYAEGMGVPSLSGVSSLKLLWKL